MSEAELEAFRQETVAWLEENCPPLMRTPEKDSEAVWGGRRAVFQSEDAKIWLQRMCEKGWTAPNWPQKYGGAGLNKEQEAILHKEIIRLGFRTPLKSFGLWMLGPVLFDYGNEEQRLEHLPKIAGGEIRWCQGYSEPGSGSDLASLSCRADLEGDHYVVSGQKI